MDTINRNTGDARSVVYIICQLLGFFVLLGAVLALLQPLRSISNARLLVYRDIAINRLEETLGRRVVYETAHPSFFRGLEIRGLQILRPDGSIQASAERLIIRYSMEKALSGDLINALERVQLFDPYIDFNETCDSAWLKGLSEASEQAVILPPIAIKALGASFSYRANGVEGFLSNGRFELSVNSQRFGFSGSGKLNLNTGTVIGRIGTDLELSGEFASDLSFANCRLYFPYLENDWAIIRSQTLFAAYDGESVEIRKIEDRLPYDLSVVYTLRTSTWNLRLGSAAFIPSAVIDLPKLDQRFVAWLDSPISGLVHLDGDLSGINNYKIDILTETPQSFELGASSISISGSGDLSKATISTIDIQTPIGNLSFNGVVEFSPARIDGFIRLSALRMDKTFNLSFLLAENRSVPQFSLRSLSYDGLIEFASFSDFSELRGDGRIVLEKLAFSHTSISEWGPIAELDLSSFSLKNLIYDGSWDTREGVSGSIALENLKIDKAIKLRLNSGTHIHIPPTLCADFFYEGAIEAGATGKSTVLAKNLSLKIDRISISALELDSAFQYYSDDTPNFVIPPFQLASLAFQGHADMSLPAAQGRLTLGNVNLNAAAEFAAGRDAWISLPVFHLDQLSLTGSFNAGNKEYNPNFAKVSELVISGLNSAGQTEASLKDQLNIAVAPLSLSSLSFDGEFEFVDANSVTISARKTLIEELRTYSATSIRSSAFKAVLPALSLAKARYGGEAVFSQGSLDGSVELLDLCSYGELGYQNNDLGVNISALSFASLSAEGAFGRSVYGALLDIAISDFRLNQGSSINDNSDYLELGAARVASFEFDGLLASDNEGFFNEFRADFARLVGLKFDGATGPSQLWPHAKLAFVDFTGSLSLAPFQLTGGVSLNELNLSFTKEIDEYDMIQPDLSLKEFYFNGSAAAVSLQGSSWLSELELRQKIDLGFGFFKSLELPPLALRRLEASGSIFSDLSSGAGRVMVDGLAISEASDLEFAGLSLSALPAISMQNAVFDFSEAYAGNKNGVSLAAKGLRVEREFSFSVEKGPAIAIPRFSLDQLDTNFSFDRIPLSFEGDLTFTKLSIGDMEEPISLGPSLYPDLVAKSLTLSGHLQPKQGKAEGDFQAEGFKFGDFRSDDASFTLNDICLPNIQFSELAYTGALSWLESWGKGSLVLRDAGFGSDSGNGTSFSIGKDRYPAIHIGLLESKGDFNLNRAFWDGSLDLENLVLGNLGDRQGAASLLLLDMLALDGRFTLNKQELGSLPQMDLTQMSLFVNDLSASGIVDIKGLALNPTANGQNSLSPLIDTLPQFRLERAYLSGELSTGGQVDIEDFSLREFRMAAVSGNNAFSVTGLALPPIAAASISFSGKATMNDSAGLSGKLNARNLVIGPDRNESYIIGDREVPRLSVKETTLTGSLKLAPRAGELDWWFSDLAIGDISPLTAQMYIDVDGNSGSLFCDTLEAGGYALSAIDCVLALEPEFLNFTISALRFREDPGKESVSLTKYIIDGETALNAPYLQAAITLESFSAGDAIRGVQSVYPKLLEEVELPTFIADILLTTELYLSTDFKNLSFNAPNTVLAYIGAFQAFMVADVSGNQERIEGQSISFNIGGQNIRGDFSLDFKDFQDLSFFTKLRYRENDYTASGFLLDGRMLSIQGSHGLDVNMIFADSGAVSGTIKAESFPLPIADYRFTASADTSLAWTNSENWNLALARFEVEESTGSLPRPYRISLSAAVDQDGADLSGLNVEDGIGELEGVARLRWDRSFTRLEGSADLSDLLGIERYNLQAVFDNTELEGFKGFEATARFANAKLSRLLDQHFDAVLSGELRGTWKDSHDFEAAVKLAELKARYNDEDLRVQASAYIDQDRIDIEDAVLSYVSFTVNLPTFTVNRADSVAALETRFNGVFAGYNLDTTVDVTLEFNPISDWLAISDAASSFSGQAAFTKTSFGFISIDDFPVIFKKNDDVIKLREGPQKAFNFTALTDGTFTASISSPLALRGNINGTLSNGRIEAEAKNVYLDFPSLWNFLGIQGVSFPGGNAVGSIRISGPIGDPEFFGEAQASGFRVIVPDWVDEELGPVSANVQFEGRDFVFGPVALPNKPGATLAGRFRFDRWIPIDFKIEAVIPPSAPLKAKVNVVGIGANGDAAGILRVAYQASKLSITGDLEFENIPITLDAAGIAASRSQARAPNAVDVNIRLRTGRKVEFSWPSVDFPVLRASADTGDVLRIIYDGLRGTYSVVGDISFRGGEIFYFQRYFYISDGALRFNENELRFDPIIGVRAETRERYDTGPITISLIIDEAALSNFIPRLESDPPLSQVEIFALLGQSLSGSGGNDENSLPSTVIAASSDLLAQFSVIRRFESSVREFLNFDIFSVRTQLIQNAVLSAAGIQTSGMDRVSGLGNYFDNTTVYMGKYLGTDLFLQAMVALQYDERDFYSALGGLKLEWDIGMELKTPFFLLRWNFLPSHPENLFIDDHSFTLTWRRSL